MLRPSGWKGTLGGGRDGVMSETHRMSETHSMWTDRQFGTCAACLQHCEALKKISIKRIHNCGGIYSHMTHELQCICIT